MRKLSISGILIAYVVLGGCAQQLMGNGTGIGAIAAAAGKTNCYVDSVALENKRVNAGLCVTQGSFSHDRYALAINDKPVVSGIDDETTSGVKGQYEGGLVSLKCTPVIQGASSSIMSVEVGRDCLVRFGSQQLLRVSVTFE